MSGLVPFAGGVFYWIAAAACLAAWMNRRSDVTDLLRWSNILAGGATFLLHALLFLGFPAALLFAPASLTGAAVAVAASRNPRWSGQAQCGMFVLACAVATLEFMTMSAIVVAGVDPMGATL